ncbi:glycoside hydrolase family 43 protein [Chitinophaga sp.]|uniref:glycoside hydrolase family 43 protein n=1 Tax=Chitinophaga sp. TaxID=1869181 RepID=UPI0031D1F735
MVKRTLLSCLCMFLAVAGMSQNVYLFAYFKGNGEDGLHLAYSKDGYNWSALKGDSSFLTPTVSKDKLMRDPCIIRGGDGLFHMVWTVSWNDKGIGYASSKDLVHWSEQAFIPVMAKEDSARNCWAPEITYDAPSKTYMIYWATTISGQFKETAASKEAGYNHRMYYVTTKDFKTYSETKLLYNPGFNVIDATIVKDGARYMMVMKDETIEPPAKYLRLAYSSKLTGPYTKAGPSITGKYWAEGPTTVKIGNTWLIYFDKYTEHKYGAISSADGKEWKDISDKISLPKGIRHGTIFTVSEKEFSRLLH